MQFAQRVLTDAQNDCYFAAVGEAKEAVASEAREQSWEA